MGDQVEKILQYARCRQSPFVGWGRRPIPYGFLLYSGLCTAGDSSMLKDECEQITKETAMQAVPFCPAEYDMLFEVLSLEVSLPVLRVTCEEAKSSFGIAAVPEEEFMVAIAIAPDNIFRDLLEISQRCIVDGPPGGSQKEWQRVEGYIFLNFKPSEEPGQIYANVWLNILNDFQENSEYDAYGGKAAYQVYYGNLVAEFMGRCPVYCRVVYQKFENHQYHLISIKPATIYM